MSRKCKGVFRFFLSHSRVARARRICSIIELGGILGGFQPRAIMYASCVQKQERVKQRFADCATAEQRYTRIMELGREMPPLAVEYKVADNLVKGCQSMMYLHSYLDEKGCVVFEGESDALISLGLAALLIAVYSGETPEAILKCPPTFLDDLQIATSLSPNRASGLYSLHVRMRQDALKYLVGGK